MYLRLVPHPTVIMTHLWIHRMYVCTCKYLCIWNSHLQTLPHNLLINKGDGNVTQ